MQRRSSREKLPALESESSNEVAAVVHRVPRRLDKTTQTSADLLGELERWSATFHEAVKILAEAIPYPSKYIRTPEEEREILLDMCRRVTTIAVNPRQSAEYKELASKMERYETQIESLNGRCQEMTETLTTKVQPPSESSRVNQQLDRLERMLAEQINEQRRILAEASEHRARVLARSPIGRQRLIASPPGGSPMVRDPTEIPAGFDTPKGVKKKLCDSEDGSSASGGLRGARKVRRT
jgi:hypothetical protein